MMRLQARVSRWLGRSRYPGLWLGTGIIVVALVVGWATLLGVKGRADLNAGGRET